jgi:hypothetical protein
MWQIIRPHILVWPILVFALIGVGDFIRTAMGWMEHDLAPVIGPELTNLSWAALGLIRVYWCWAVLAAAFAFFCERRSVSKSKVSFKWPL